MEFTVHVHPHIHPTVECKFTPDVKRHSWKSLTMKVDKASGEEIAPVMHLTSQADCTYNCKSIWELIFPFEGESTARFAYLKLALLFCLFIRPSRLYRVYGLLRQHGESWSDSKIHWCQHAVRDAELQPSPRQLQNLPMCPGCFRSLCVPVWPPSARLHCDEDTGRKPQITKW